MNGKEEHYPDYPLFKGLQRPLEFMGIQGRYIYWAAATIGIAIVGPDCPVRHRDKRCGTDSVQAAQGIAQQTAGTWGVHLCLLKENVTENHLTMNGYIEC